MTRTDAAALAMTLVLPWSVAAAERRSPADRGSRPTITLRLVNEGGVERQPLISARKETTRIFDHSGIDLVWLDCESGRAEWGSGSPCQLDRGSAEFWVRIVTRRPSAVTADMLGFTELDATQAQGSAGVYYPAAVEMAKNGRASVGEVLAAAIAHEVGHLILGANAHSPSGVMLAHWGKPQCVLIGTSALNFTGDQSAMLRERIAGRTPTTLTAR